MSGDMAFGLAIVIASLLLLVALVLLSLRSIEAIHRRGISEGSDALPQHGAEKKHGRRK